MEIFVLGLGHVGLPLACWIALTGQHVFGIDTDRERIDQICSGRIQIEESFDGVPLSALSQKLIAQGQLHVNTTLARHKDPAVFLICVGIADAPDGTKNLSPVVEAANMVAEALVPGDLIILRTTLIPGTCEKTVLPVFSCQNIPFSFAYCPETIQETRAFEELESHPLILASQSESSEKTALAFWKSLGKKNCVCTRNFRAAELAKVVQNLHRDVDIAFANEIGWAAAQLDVDPEELQKLVNVNPRVHMLTAGPGVGGYCLPNALSYLCAALPEEPLLSRTARAVNEKQPVKMVDLAEYVLQKEGKAMTGATVAVIGLAMKSNCADLRNSPALDVVGELTRRGAVVRAYDPLIPPTFPFQVSSLTEALSGADCLIILAMQKGLELDGAEITTRMAPAPIVIDTQRVLRRLDGAVLVRI